MKVKSKRMLLIWVVGLGLLLGVLSPVPISREVGLITYAQTGAVTDAEVFLKFARWLMLTYTLRGPLEELAELLQRQYHDVAALHDVLYNHPAEFVKFLVEEGQATSEFQLDGRAGAAALGTVGLLDSDIVNWTGDAIKDLPEDAKGEDLFNAVHAKVKQEIGYHISDIGVANKLIQIYAKSNYEEAITMSDADIQLLVSEVAQVYGKKIGALIDEAFKRVQVPSISELERQVAEMASRLSQLTEQLGALQQEVKGLKQQRASLPLVLAIIAILAAIAVS